MADVFLSYSHRDSPIADRLRQQLRVAGIDVFWDRDIATGMPLLEAVSSAIAEAKVFVLLHPGESGLSGFIQREMQAAIARSTSGHLQLLPILIPGRVPTDDIGNFRYVRVDSDHDFSAAIAVVADALKISTRSGPSRDDLRLSFLWSVLDSDLSRAPQASAIVLDEIASSVRGSTSDASREIDLLRRATGWAEAHLGPEHQSLIALRYQLNTALLRAALFDESIELTQQMFVKAAGPREKLELSLGLGHALFQSGRLEEALREYEAALIVANETASISASTTCLVALGSIARVRGDLDQAEGLYARALEESALLAQPSARVSALIGLCEVAAQKGDTEAERRWAGEAMWLSKTALEGNDALALRAAALHGPEGGG